MQLREIAKSREGYKPELLLPLVHFPVGSHARARQLCPLLVQLQLASR